MIMACCGGWAVGPARPFDVGKLFRMGCNSFLMNYMDRFEVCGLNAATYNERMRAEKIDDMGRPAA